MQENNKQDYQLKSMNSLMIMNEFVFPKRINNLIYPLSFAIFEQKMQVKTNTQLMEVKTDGGYWRGDECLMPKQINFTESNQIVFGLQNQKNQLMKHPLPLNCQSHSQGQQEKVWRMKKHWEEDTTSSSGHESYDWVQEVQYGGNAVCEDRMKCGELKTINACVVSIFDGHGGYSLAQYCSNRINQLLDMYLREHPDGSRAECIKAALKWAYWQMDEGYYEEHKERMRGNRALVEIGTCAITVVIHCGMLYVANAGDSQAALVTQLTICKLNKRLSTRSAAERNRIYKEFGNEPNILVKDQGTFYLKGKLQPTRAIGDYSLKKAEMYGKMGQFHGPYLTCEPVIEVMRMDNTHRYLLVASDGLWDALDKTAIHEAIYSQGEVDLENKFERGQKCVVVNKLLKAVLGKCALDCNKSLKELQSMPMNKRRDYHDDITIALVDLSELR